MNNDIGFFKFFYCWFIVFYHFMPEDTLFQGGYFGVEFYVLVAGIFFFRSYEKQAAAGALESPGLFFRKRFTRLFPWALTAFVYTLVILRRDFLLHDFSLGDAMDFFSSDIWEILLIKWNGMNEGNSLMLNVPVWTMSSLLLVGFVLWGLLYFYDKKFLRFFMPVSLLIGYGLWRHLDEAYAGTWMGITTVGTMRTYFAMCLGYYSLQLGKWLSAVRFNRLGSLLLGLAELCGHAFLVWAMLTRSTRYYQWLCTLVILLVCAIALSGQSALYHLLQRSRLIPWLQDISLSVYLVHFATFDIYRHFYGDSLAPQDLLVLVGMILAASVCHKTLTQSCMSLCRRLGPTLRRSITREQA